MVHSEDVFSYNPGVDIRGRWIFLWDQ